MFKQKKKITDQTEQELIEMGKFYLINNKFDEAIIEFKKALEISPGNAEIYYNLGLVYETKNELDMAKKMYEKALSINPEYKIVKQHLDKIVGL
jgi:tetratricopeptide (TPR) repeat protein